LLTRVTRPVSGANRSLSVLTLSIVPNVLPGAYVDADERDVAELIDGECRDADQNLVAIGFRPLVLTCVLPIVTDVLGCAHDPFARL
jgi:hypothetical protein